MADYQLTQQGPTVQQAINKALEIQGLLDQETAARQAADALLATKTELQGETTRAEAAEALLATISSLQAEIDRATGAEGSLQTLIDAIAAKIPSGASSSNQLADKSFVNSSIATSTATFRGTYSSLSALEAVTADENDYGYVTSTDSAGNTLYSRYKYASGNWVFEYALNNSSFTAAEWAAIQSGITSALVSKLSSLPENSALQEALGSKYVKPSTGIPKADLASGIQTSLNKADSSLQSNAIADNLTTDDATKVLSAKQGVVLAGQVSQLGQEVNGVNFNPTLVWTGSKRIIEDGSIVNSGSSFSISDFVEVQEGLPITVYGVNGYASVTAPSVHFYNGSQVHVGYLYATGTADISAKISELHAKYVRFSQYDDGNYPTSGVSIRAYVAGCVKETEMAEIYQKFDNIDLGYRIATNDDFSQSIAGKFKIENGSLYGVRQLTDPAVMIVFNENIKAVEFEIASLWDSNLLSFVLGIGVDTGNDKPCFALSSYNTSLRPDDGLTVGNKDYDGDASAAQNTSLWGQGHGSGDYRSPQVKPYPVAVGDKCRIELIDGHFFKASVYNSTSGCWDFWWCIDTNGTWNNPKMGWTTRRAIGVSIQFAVITTWKELIKNIHIVSEAGETSSIYTGLSKNFPQKKQWVAIGDSITEIDVNNGLSYVGYAQRKLDYLVDNQGKGGWTIYKLWRDRVSAGWEDAVSAIKDGDIVTILAGTNDFDTASFYTPSSDEDMDASGNPHPRFGTTDPTSEDAKDPHTTLGCLRLMIERILTLKPGARLSVFSPFYREKGAPVGQTSWTKLFINADGKTIYDYADAIYSVAREYNLPAYNTCRDCGINALTLATYTYDDLHIGQLGGELIGDYVAKRI